ncbi:hypothetical protein F4703DRAFT_1917000 [Phycomyces blakesleeanus]
MNTMGAYPQSMKLDLKTFKTKIGGHFTYAVFYQCTLGVFSGSVNGTDLGARWKVSVFQILLKADWREAKRATFHLGQGGEGREREDVGGVACMQAVGVPARKIEDLGDFEICYNVDPKQPILVLRQRICGNLFPYRTYLHSGDIPDKSSKRKRIEFQTESQVIQFINEVYLPEEPHNTNIYDIKLVYTAEIYDTVRKHAAIFENKAVLSFSRWCSSPRVSFLRVEEEQKITFDSLPIFTSVSGDNQESKKKEFEIVGYARKPPSNDKDEKRVKLLQKMVDNLQNRSLTTRVYASFSSSASTPFSERDTTNNKSMIAKLNNVKGDTQVDIATYLEESTPLQIQENFKRYQDNEWTAGEEINRSILPKLKSYTVDTAQVVTVIYKSLGTLRNYGRPATELYEQLSNTQ